MVFYLARKQFEIGYGVIPSERGKGYATEAAMMLVDYLFLSKDIVRIQADTTEGNISSQRVLEKVGFKRERACYTVTGKMLYSVVFYGKNGRNPEFLLSN